MTDRYDRTVARHYAAFRPPLHRLILDRVIRPNESFPVGLDVGCGTGCSAVALTKYCDRVFGLDSSRSMLDATQRHPKISYFHGSGDALSQLPVQVFDVVTFAGSLFYTKTDRLCKELVRVCPAGGLILVYDFEVLLNEVMAKVGVDYPPITSDYNHRTNLSGWAEFVADSSGTERLLLDVSENEMAHLLLANSNRYDAFLNRFPNSDPFESLVEYLRKFSGEFHLHADIYFTRYQVWGK
jgi:SAM-dependent methyltransferase